MLKQTLSIIIIFTLLFNIASAIEHPSVKITKYDLEIFQEPGTTKTYQVEVQNTGDVPLDSVYLSLFFLPSTWYKFENGVRLEVNDKKIFNYNLSIPSDASGSIVYNLTANAIRGFGAVSNSAVPVVLKMQKVQITQTTQTIPAETPIKNETGIFEIKNSDSSIVLIILILIGSLAISVITYKLI